MPVSCRGAPPTHTVPVRPNCLMPGIANLPAGITKLKHLTCLDVSGCPLAFLPSQLWKLSHLRHLRLNGGGRVGWPGELSSALVCGAERPAHVRRAACIRTKRGRSPAPLPPLAGTNLMVGLAHTWEPLSKLPALESVELR